MLTLTLFLAALAFQVLAAPTTTTAGYDIAYDLGSSSLDTGACSSGLNWLETKGYSKFSSLPTFPLIAAVPTITGFDSPACGNCFAVSYTAPSNNTLSPPVTSTTNGLTTTTIYVIGVDSSRGNGFVLSKAAMDRMTVGKAVELGRVSVAWEEVDGGRCGM
ncbi:Cerato-platanin [Pterulicium gracile]|uniref:Cerato-platanin n=1 Tax=Pterulicium gracile TaxID=1884261 RepID=A0A5C3Q5K9_9AGAR|nr:Cerato-platanin [Pterula gracilis]